jgi:hypothetical protein
MEVTFIHNWKLYITRAGGMKAALRQNWRDEDSYGDITEGMEAALLENWRYEGSVEI